MASVLRALTRARWSILSVALTYALSVTVGAVLVHTGNPFALGQLDSLLGRVNATSDPTLKALAQGNRLQAAALDFGGNLGLAWLRPAAYYRGDKFLDVPQEALRDAARIYVLVAPLFAIASLWEFLAR